MEIFGRPRDHLLIEKKAALIPFSSEVFTVEVRINTLVTGKYELNGGK